MCDLLEGHLGLGDKTLAEFIIHLHSELKSPPSFAEFKVSLANVDESFPSDLADAIFKVLSKKRVALV